MVSKYQVDIQEHIRRRIAIFWHQLVACYGTKLHLEVDYTMDQGESAKKLKVIFSGKEETFVKRNAAHSATFPSLKACSQKEWDKYKRGEIDKPTMFSFLKGSDLYNLANSVIIMIEDINLADLQIDGHHHDSTFSKKALYLLNWEFAAVKIRCDATASDRTPTNFHKASIASRSAASVWPSMSATH